MGLFSSPNSKWKGTLYEQKHHSLRTRLTALLLALVCTFGLIPTTAFAAGDTIKLKDFGYTGVTYESAALGRAQSIRCISKTAQPRR